MYRVTSYPQWQKQVLFAGSLNQMKTHKKFRYQEVKVKVLGTWSGAVTSSKLLLRYCRLGKPFRLLCDQSPTIGLYNWQRGSERQHSPDPNQTWIWSHHLHGCKWCQWRKGTLLTLLTLCKTAFDLEKHETLPGGKGRVSSVKITWIFPVCCIV